MAVQNEVLLTSPIQTLGDFDPAARRAKLIVESEGTGRPGETYPLAAELIDPLKWTFEDGVARNTRVYTNPRGTWITAFAPILDPARARGRRGQGRLPGRDLPRPAP